MILQRKFIQMLIIILTCIFSISIGQINSPEKPKSPNQIQVMDDARVHDLHQYLLDNKAIFENHLILMSHPEYYVMLNEIINKMDDIIVYNDDQPVIDKKELKSIGLVFEDLHYIDYNQLRTQIKHQIIRNKINFIISGK